MVPIQVMSRSKYLTPIKWQFEYFLFYSVHFIIIRTKESDHNHAGSIVIYFSIGIRLIVFLLGFYILSKLH